MISAPSPSVLVAGATSGIGAEIVCCYHAASGWVVIWDIGRTKPPARSTPAPFSICPVVGQNTDCMTFVP